MRSAAWGGSSVPRLAGLETLTPRAEMDTAPYAGVVLVLLIIFMVVTPALGGPYLPRAATAEVVEDRLPAVGVDERGFFYVDDRPVPDAELPSAVALLGASKAVLLTADRDVEYGRVETVLGALREAGIRRVALEAWLPRPRATVEH